MQAMEGSFKRLPILAQLNNPNEVNVPFSNSIGRGIDCKEKSFNDKSR